MYVNTVCEMEYISEVCVCVCVCVSRALCYLKVERFAEAKQDCDTALSLEPTNKKAFYRRALANKGLKVSSPEETRQQHTHTHTDTHKYSVHSHLCRSAMGWSQH